MHPGHEKKKTIETAKSQANLERSARIKERRKREAKDIGNEAANHLVVSLKAFVSFKLCVGIKTSIEHKVRK